LQVCSIGFPGWRWQIHIQRNFKKWKN